DNKCADCNTYAEVKARVHLAKQLQVKNILEENNISYKAYDSIMGNQGYSKKRSDFVIDVSTHKVVLEVDEYQYKKGEYNCEVKKYEIPYNSNNKERTHNLLSCIRDATHSQPARELQFLQATYLFYNGYDKSNIEITTVSDVWFRKQ
ncbi:6855_t:CDS:2, partial [Funneliformis caledonium]